MVKLNAARPPSENTGEDAIARVLRAEREARHDIELTQHLASQIAEAARSNARSVADRTERRIRSVASAFERELAARLFEIDAEAAAMSQPHEPTAAELQALDRGVVALARELTGVPP
jgi:hypothetical protein